MRVFFLVACFAAACAVVGTASSADTPSPQASTPKQSANLNQQGTEQAPLIVRIAPLPKTGTDRAEEATERKRIAEAERKKEESDSKLVEFTGELAAFTKGLFLATIALVVATFGLGMAAFFQSRDAKAANRPWIGLSLGDGNGPPIVNGSASLHVVVMSAGKSPARITLMEAASIPIAGEFPDSPQFPKIATKPGQTILVPGTASNMRWQLQLVGNENADVQSDALTFYIYARVNYEDIVTGKKHFTTMCQRYVPALGTYLLIDKYNNAK